MFPDEVLFTLRYPNSGRREKEGLTGETEEGIKERKGNGGQLVCGLYVLTRQPDISLHRRPGQETTSVSCLSWVTRGAERRRTGGGGTLRFEQNKDGRERLERRQLQ